MSDTYALFTHDLVDLIIEKSRQAKEARDESNGDFEIGQLMAFHDVVTLIQQQAEVFGIPPEAIGLSGVNPDIDLL